MIRVLKMDRKTRLRRVVLLCAHFTRNLAYLRTGRAVVKKTSSQFCVTTAGNFVDIAILEWCKLFGGRSENHSWRNVVKDPESFERALLADLNLSTDEMRAYIRSVRQYRDKFLAHLDDLTTMDIPALDTAYAAVKLYHRHIVKTEASPGDLAGLPDNLERYYRDCLAKGRKAYRLIGKTGLL